jgi:hypothetical protein
VLPGAVGWGAARSRVAPCHLAGDDRNTRHEEARRINDRWSPIAGSWATRARIGYGLSLVGIAARISGASRTNCERRWDLAFGRRSNQVHRVADEADRAAGHGHGEELAKSSSSCCLLAPMLALAIARTLSASEPGMATTTTHPGRAYAGLGGS